MVWQINWEGTIWRSSSKRMWQQKKAEREFCVAGSVMANVEHFIVIYPATPGCSQAEYERLAEESALKRKMLT